jgi:hypothetical protein
MKMYKYCLINLKTKHIELYNNKPNTFNTSVNKVLIDVTVYPTFDGITILGYELQYKWTDTPIKIDKVEDRLYSGHVHKFNGIKWLGIKPCKYVYHWYAIISENKISYTMKDNYSLKEEL